MITKIAGTRHNVYQINKSICTICTICSCGGEKQRVAGRHSGQEHPRLEQQEQLLLPDAARLLGPGVDRCDVAPRENGSLLPDQHTRLLHGSRRRAAERKAHSEEDGACLSRVSFIIAFTILFSRLLHVLYVLHVQTFQRLKPITQTCFI